MKRKFCIFLTLLLVLSNGLYAEDTTPESYDKVNFPQWAKDLRRTEIIAFGSLPFVTLWTTVIYSYSVYGEFHNPLDKSTSSFTEDEQWKIIQMSAATCVALGLADLAINIIIRKVNKNRQGAKVKNNAIDVFPAGQEGFDELPGNKSDIDLKPEVPDIFKCGVESAIF